jgi:hypothetical protein
MSGGIGDFPLGELVVLAIATAALPSPSWKAATSGPTACSGGIKATVFFYSGLDMMMP